RKSPLKSSSSAHPFHQTYRLQTLHAEIYDRQIEEAFRILRASGIDPILGKGWAVARHYPERGLRPSGDIDLYVHPEQHAMATAALQGSSAPWDRVDLHSGISHLRDRAFGDVYDRSQLVHLGNTEVRVFGPEDHLKLLCIHTLGVFLERSSTPFGLGCLRHRPCAPPPWCGHRRHSSCESHPATAEMAGTHRPATVGRNQNSSWPPYPNGCLSEEPNWNPASAITSLAERDRGHRSRRRAVQRNAQAPLPGR
ncbi:MAG: hypothetical protein DMG08_14400, partial [Acidobacteria bacterium]